MADLLQKYYSQVKNPNPVFTPREGAGTLKFCEKLMEKAVGFTSRFDFAIHVAHARSKAVGAGSGRLTFAAAHIQNDFP